VAALGVLATPGAAAAAPGWGYVFADQPSGTGYAPATQGNSTGALNVVERIGVGTYTVGFRGLANTGGTVDVTAVGAFGPPASCTSGGFESSGAFLLVRVTCFDTTGASVDSAFEAGWTRAAGISTGRFAYVGGGASAVPKRYLFNSTGGTATSTSIGTGLYQVDLARLASAGGTVKVTAVGTPGVVCSPVSWHRQGSAERAFVACATAAGAATDSRFTLTFADRTSLFGVPAMASGYVWANQPSAASYVAEAKHSFDSAGGRPTIQRSRTGVYQVTLPGLAGPGHAHVAPTGGPNRTCELTSVGPSGTAETLGVACSDETGAPADTPFTAQFLRPA
jgi:hypothetical protein